MDNQVIFAIAYCAVTVGAFLAGKYIFPNIPASVKDKLADLAGWAAKFVVWAREFMKQDSGEKKMAAVVEQLKQIAAEAGIEVTEDQLRAIAQSAYEAMKKGEAAAQPAQLLEAITAPAMPTVVINTHTAAVATDNVPEGALTDNPDGAVNAYDAVGNKVGTVSAEAAEEAASNAGVIITEGNG